MNNTDTRLDHRAIERVAHVLRSVLLTMSAFDAGRVVGALERGDGEWVMSPDRGTFEVRLHDTLLARVDIADLMGADDDFDLVLDRD